MRQLGRLGVWYPIDRLDAAGIKRLLRTIEDLGYSTFWYPEALGYESLSIASFMLANTERLIIGSSIANIYARDPFTARRGLRTLSGLYDDRFILGLGVSHAPMVEKLRGHVYDRPMPTMRRYLDGLYEDPSNATEWPVVIAALGPLMLNSPQSVRWVPSPTTSPPNIHAKREQPWGRTSCSRSNRKFASRPTSRRHGASPVENSSAT
jgi:Luciferase-like monooxygenase